MHLPENPQELLTWTWAQFEPLYAALNQTALTAENLETWLHDWSHLDEAAVELENRLYVAITQDTGDQASEARFNLFIEEVQPKIHAAAQALKEKLLASALPVPDGLDLAVERMRTEAALFREENLPLITQEQKLSNAYAKKLSEQSVVWDGEERTLSQMTPFLLKPIRMHRELAWRRMNKRRLEDRAALNELWVSLYTLRREIAHNAGLDNFRDYRWRQLHRSDYTPQDCLSFHEAIADAVVPAATRIYERRRKLFGYETLRPWDLDADPLNRAPLAPFETHEQLTAGTAAIFNQVDPVLGGYFKTMIDQKLIDLDNRKGKAPGGYCTEFPYSRLPFIFTNAVGLHDDVQTLLHEGGHCFHTFESSRLPYYPQTQVTNEFAEVASMGMELLAAPYLEKSNGGFYTPQDAARAQIEHLEGMILFWPYMSVVDSFQHWAYTHPNEGGQPARCDEIWTELWQRFMPGIDYRGLEDVRATGWHNKLHIFQLPFYYIEYGLAQLGAAQVWSNSLTDPAGALADYRKALALGGTRSLPDLFRAAGAQLAFDRATLAAAVEKIEARITQLEAIAA